MQLLLLYSHKSTITDLAYFRMHRVVLFSEEYLALSSMLQLFKGH